MDEDRLGAQYSSRRRTVQRDRIQLAAWTKLTVACDEVVHSFKIDLRAMGETS